MELFSLFFALGLCEVRTLEIKVSQQVKSSIFFLLFKPNLSPSLMCSVPTPTQVVMRSPAGVTKCSYTTPERQIRGKTRNLESISGKQKESEERRRRRRKTVYDSQQKLSGCVCEDVKSLYRSDTYCKIHLRRFLKAMDPNWFWKKTKVPCFFHPKLTCLYLGVRAKQEHVKPYLLRSVLSAREASDVCSATQIHTFLFRQGKNGSVCFFFKMDLKL